MPNAAVTPAWLKGSDIDTAKIVAARHLRDLTTLPEDRLFRAAESLVRDVLAAMTPVVEARENDAWAEGYAGGHNGEAPDEFDGA